DESPAGPRAATTDPAKSWLSGFAILGELGRGSVGVVYRARQLDLDREVAVKMLRQDDQDPDWVQRLRHEAEAVARLHHPNTLPLVGIGSQNGQPYLVLEYVAGGTLADRLRTDPLRPREAAELVRVVASAVHAAHEREIVHRDLKPGNILLKRADVS